VRNIALTEPLTGRAITPAITCHEELPLDLDGHAGLPIAEHALGPSINVPRYRWFPGG